MVTEAEEENSLSLNDINDIKIGDLVKWFEYYAEGDIVRDAGWGLVVRVLERSQPPHPGESVLYLVHRVHRQGQEWYTRHNIDLIAEGVIKKKA